MRRMKLAATMLVMLLVAACSAAPESDRSAQATTASAENVTAVKGGKAPEAATIEKKEIPKGPQAAVLETTLGTIVIQLHESEAPKTTANFKKLVHEGFYDGTYFHRVIPGFMIQGGDPNSKNETPDDDGTGGPGYTVPAEIGSKHVRGAVATARLGDQVNPKKDSSGSQFFIDVAPQPALDRGGYTVFGQVISGLDAVDKIVAIGSDAKTPKGPGGPNPGKQARIERAYLEPLAKWQKAANEVKSNER